LPSVPCPTLFRSVAALVRQREDVAPLRRGRGRREPEALDQYLVVRDRHRDVDEAPVQPRPHGHTPRILGPIQLQGEVVAGRAGTAGIGLEDWEGDGLAAVIAKPELPEGGERGLVVAEVRPAEAARRD